MPGDPRVPRVVPPPPAPHPAARPTTNNPVLDERLSRADFECGLYSQVLAQMQSGNEGAKEFIMSTLNSKKVPSHKDRCRLWLQNQPGGIVPPGPEGYALTPQCLPGQCNFVKVKGASATCFRVACTVCTYRKNTERYVCQHQGKHFWDYAKSRGTGVMIASDVLRMPRLSVPGRKKEYLGQCC